MATRSSDSSSRVMLSVQEARGADDRVLCASTPTLVSNPFPDAKSDEIGITDALLDPHGTLIDATDESLGEFLDFVEALGGFMGESGIEEWGYNQLSIDNVIDRAYDFYSHLQETGNPLYAAGLTSVQIHLEMAQMFLDDILPFLADWLVNQENRRRQRQEREKEKENEEEPEPPADGPSSGGGGGGGGGGGSGGGPGGGPGSGSEGDPPDDDYDDPDWDDPDWDDPDWDDDRDPLREIVRSPGDLLRHTREISDTVGDLMGALDELDPLIEAGAIDPREIEEWRDLANSINRDGERVEGLLSRISSRGGPSVGLAMVDPPCVDEVPGFGR